MTSRQQNVDTPAHHLWNKHLQRPSQYSAWSLLSTTYCSHTAHFTGHRLIDPSSMRPSQALVLLGADFNAEVEFTGVGEVVVFMAVVVFVASRHQVCIWAWVSTCAISLTLTISPPLPLLHIVLYCPCQWWVWPQSTQICWGVWSAGCPLTWFTVCIRTAQEVLG